VLAKYGPDDYSNLLHRVALTHSAISVGIEDSVPQDNGGTYMKQRKQDLDSAIGYIPKTFPAPLPTVNKRMGSKQ